MQEIKRLEAQLEKTVGKIPSTTKVFDDCYKLVERCIHQGELAKLSEILLIRYCALALNHNKSNLVIDQLISLKEKSPLTPIFSLCLAGVFGALDEDGESSRYALHYSSIRPVSPGKAKNARINLLILKTIASGKFRLVKNTSKFAIREGHNNLDSLLDSGMNKTVVRVDSPDAAISAIRNLPFKPDLVFNNITDPERCEKALKNAKNICEAISLPVINHPDKLLETTRERVFIRFKNNTNIILPRSMKFESVQAKGRDLVEKAIENYGFELPLIIRLAGFQGGKFMHKVDDLSSHDFSELDTELLRQSQTVYIIQYHDVSYFDERLPGTLLFPKYRAFFVNGKLYPCHLFTADYFNVHLKQAAPVMSANKWLVEKERDYCLNPERHIGVAQWEALGKAMKDIGLDYNGVDFAPATSPEHKGKLVIFEANPAMRNWVKQLPDGDHVQQAWARITRASHQLFAEKAKVDSWEFHIPKGKPLENTPLDFRKSNQIIFPGDVEASIDYYQSQVEKGQLTEEEIIQWLTLASSLPIMQDRLDEVLRVVIARFGKEQYLSDVYASFELVYAWRTGRYSLARQHIIAHISFLKSRTQPLATRMKIFFNFVLQLMRTKKRHEYIYKSNYDIAQLMVVGESHSLAPASSVFYWEGKKHKAQSCFVIGLKMHHLANPSASHHAFILKSHLTGMGRHEPLLFCLGEIDCRPDEGFWRVVKNKNLNLELLVEQTLDGYLDFLIRHIPNVKHRSITIQGVPAPGYRFNAYKTEGEESDFLAMIALVNERLKEKVLAYGWGFLDVYAASSDEFGRGNKKYHIDANHLSPCFYQEADKWLVHCK